VTNRGQLKLEEVVVAQTSSGISRWSLFYNPTFAGGSWVNIDTTNSIAEYNEGATVTGGVEIHSGLLVGTVQNDDSVQAEISSKLPIVIGADGTSQYGIALVVYAYAGTETVSGGMNWKEFR
jgi:hypothetical protein